MIENAIYTDCLSEEAFDGRDGFNFQAVSSGIDGIQRRTIIADALHQIQVNWDNGKDPELHPRSVIYLHQDDYYYWSRGKSTGMTYSGRRGNFLSEVIISNNLDDIRPYRPAQVFAALNWRVAKAETQELQPWEVPIQVSEEFDIFNIVSFIKEDSWFLEQIPAIVTGFELASNLNTYKRLVIVTSSEDIFLRIMCFGSSLISEKKAFTLEFRGLIGNPMNARGDVIGVHPELFDVDPFGANVINLEDHTTNIVEYTPLARQISSWIKDLDSFDAFELINLCRNWQDAFPEDELVKAVHLVLDDRFGKLTSLDDWKIAIKVLTQLSKLEFYDDLNIYCDTLVDIITSYCPSTLSEYQLIAQVINSAIKTNLEEIAVAILLPSMECLVEYPNCINVFFEELFDGDTFVWPASIDHDRLLSLITALINHASKSAIRTMLLVSKSIEDSLPPKVTRLLVDQAVKLLVSNPNYVKESHNWCCSMEIRYLTRKALIKQLQAENSNTLQQLTHGVWDEILDNGELSQFSNDDMNSWLRIAKIFTLSDAEKMIDIQTYPYVPDSWVVLKSLPIVKNQQLYATWLEQIGPQSGFLDYVADALSLALKPNPTKVLMSWRPIVNVLQTKYIRIDGISSLCELYEKRLGEIQTFSKKIKNIFTKKHRTDDYSLKEEL